MTILISGKTLAEDYTQKASDFVLGLHQKPGLAMILVGDNPSSLLYVNNKRKLCQKVGIFSHIKYLPAHTSKQDLASVIEKFNHDGNIHGILLQLPLPGHLDSSYFLNCIDPAKDVDGLHPYNSGLLMAGKPGMVPCTPQGCMQMIQSVMPDVSGAHAVVLGRSVLVGKPMAMLLCNANASVTLLHSKSQNIDKICKSADIVVAAIGQPLLLDRSYFNQDAIVIDVGITSVNGKTTGDVNFEDVFGHVKAISPVPFGVGPMTVVNLILNTLKGFTGYHP